MYGNSAAALELDNLEITLRRIQEIIGHSLDLDDFQTVREILERIIDRTEQILSREMS